MHRQLGTWYRVLAPSLAHLFYLPYQGFEGFLTDGFTNLWKTNLFEYNPSVFLSNGEDLALFYIKDLPGLYV